MYKAFKETLNVEIKGQLDATDWFLLQNLLFAQHVSGTIMPIIIRSSRFIQMVAAYGTCRFGLQVVGLVWSCGLCVRFVGYFRNIRTANYHFFRLQSRQTLVRI